MAVLAQDATYYDVDWKECPRSSSTYYHIEFPEGEQVYFADYYMANDQVQNTGKYLKGNESGKFLWYDQEGNQIIERNYEEGYLHGTYSEWYAKGGLKVMGNYKNGRQSGEWTWFSKKGKIKDERTFLVDNRYGERESSKWTISYDPTAEAKVTEEADPDPYDLILLDKEPSMINIQEVRDSIGYPEIAQEAKIEGKVIVKVLIGKQGQMERFIVIKDPSPILTRSVTERLEMLTFTPGIVKGRPTKCWMTIPFIFKTIR